MRLFGLILLFVILAPAVAIMELMLFWLDHSDAKREELEDSEDSQEDV